MLTVLLLLMLAAVAMAAMCRLTLRRSLEASAAADELQQRWGTLSCRDALLPNAENILEGEETAGTQLIRLHADFELNHTAVAVDICDEEAKANINALYAIKGKDRAEQSIRRLVTAAGGHLRPRLRLAVNTLPRPKSAVPTQVQPLEDTSADGTDTAYFPPVFGSWSEVFPNAEPSDLLPGVVGNVTSNLTCWGSGRLNLRRASPACITEMCSPILSPQQIARLLVVRAQFGDSITVEQALAAVQAGIANTLNLSGRLTVTPTTHSLWIVSRNHSSTHRNLIIRDASNSDDVRSFNAEW